MLNHGITWYYKTWKINSNKDKKMRLERHEVHEDEKGQNKKIKKNYTAKKQLS
jgi:hypothetical protein